MPYASSFDGLQIRYDDLGIGEPALLMMPSWCTSRHLFDELARRCSQRRRTLTIDWRGHGQSEKPSRSFGNNELIEDALSVARQSRAEQIVPVAQDNGGWLALDLRRVLGPRIAKIVFLDWTVTKPAQSYLSMLDKLQSSDERKQAYEDLVTGWTRGVEDSKVSDFVRSRGFEFGVEMWTQAAKEIRRTYSHYGSPLEALALLDQPPPVLHIYSQPHDAAFTVAQQSFAAEHPWFKTRMLNTKSQFSAVEAPDLVEIEIEEFVRANVADAMNQVATVA